MMFSLIFIALFSAPLITSISASTPPHPVSRAAPNTNDVIVQLFEWDWSSVSSECTNFLGPAGYGYVQVSPPNEHVTGSQWWTDYQPVSYTLQSKRGNRTEFQDMVEACSDAGVSVIVDAVMNHMMGSDSATGTAGSQVTHYNYPGNYQTQDFHHCGLEPGDDIVNYDSRIEVQTCELVNLADLATNTDYVQGKLAAYLNDLLSLGVAGFRIDAAKHIAATDLANIKSRLTNTGVYWTQEVIYVASEPIQPTEYTGTGDVQIFQGSYDLKRMFQSDGIAYLASPNQWGTAWGGGYLPQSNANTFVANHDTERNQQTLRWDSPNNAYTLAQIFLLAWNYGTPTVLSGYSFTDIDAGAPPQPITCYSNGWRCEHRWTAVSNMVRFHNAAKGQSITNIQTSGTQQLAFGRGAVGFVAINNADSSWTKTFTTSLPSGTYCELIHDATEAIGVCSGTIYTVSGGSFTATVGARDAIAIRVNGS